MRSKSLGFLLSFLAGLAVGYGLVFLDREATVPRLESTDIFQVVLPDGTYQHLSYAEIEREREELKRLRQRLARLEEARSAAPGAAPRKEPAEARADAEAPPPAGARPAPEGTPVPGGDESRMKLTDLFAKIFSKPVMQRIVESQVKRESGEMTAVLGLSEAQRASLEEALQKKRQALAEGRGGPRAGRPGGAPPGDADAEDPYRTILTPEQHRKYEEYTARKRDLAGASAADRELFELSWRLDLSEEQEGKAAEILGTHWERMQELSPAGVPGEEGSPLDQFDEYLQKRNALTAGTAEAMRSFLDEEQSREYVRYLEEKDTEARLFQEMIRSESSQEGDRSP